MSMLPALCWLASSEVIIRIDCHPHHRYATGLKRLYRVPVIFRGAVFARLIIREIARSSP